jgi:hypothetical protein
MTIDEFLAKLEACAGEFEWHIISGKYTNYRCVRTTEGWCPISAVWNSISGESKGGYSASVDLKIYYSDASAIVCAADIPRPDNKLRERILEIIFGEGVKV